VSESSTEKFNLLQSVCRLLAKEIRKRLGFRPRRTPISSFRFPSINIVDVKRQIHQSLDPESDRLDFFVGMSDLQVNKWHHYIPLV